MESVHRSVISYTGYKVTTYKSHIHKRVALAVAKRNDGIATTLQNFHSELAITNLPRHVIKRLGNATNE